jgi:hypothetical protein
MKKAITLLTIMLLISSCALGKMERLYENEPVKSKFEKDGKYYFVTTENDTIWVGIRDYNLKR